KTAMSCIVNVNDMHLLVGRCNRFSDKSEISLIKRVKNDNGGFICYGVFVDLGVRKWLFYSGGDRMAQISRAECNYSGINWASIIDGSISSQRKSVGNYGFAL